MNTDETKALSKFDQAVAAIVALDLGDDANSAIDMYANSIKTLVVNRSIDREMNPPPPPAPMDEGVEGIDTAVSYEPGVTGE